MKTMQPKTMSDLDFRLQESCRQHPSFGARILSRLKEYGIISAEVFSMKAKLNKNLYYDLQNHPDRERKVETVVALCLVLRFDLPTTEELLNLCEAGGFNPRNRHHLAYMELIRDSYKLSIVEIQAYIIRNNVKALPFVF